MLFEQEYMSSLYRADARPFEKHGLFERNMNIYKCHSDVSFLVVFVVGWSSSHWENLL